MPIVDIYLLLVLASGLWLGRTTARRSAGNAIIVLTFVAIIYGVRARSASSGARPCPHPVWRDAAATMRSGAKRRGWTRGAKPTPSLPADGRRCLVEIAGDAELHLSVRLANHRPDVRMRSELHDINVLDRRLPEGESEADGSHFCRVRRFATPTSGRRSCRRRRRRRSAHRRSSASRVSLPHARRMIRRAPPPSVHRRAVRRFDANRPARTTVAALHRHHPVQPAGNVVSQTLGGR